MAARGACILVLLTFAVFTDAVTLSSVVSLDDQVRFKELFYSAMPFVDLETAYHAVRSLKLMKAEVPPTQDVCRFVKDNLDSSSVESLYYASVISKSLDNCKLTVNDAETTLSEALNEGVDMGTLFYIVGTQTTLGLKVDTGEVIKAVKASINSEEDNILGQDTVGLNGGFVDVFSFSVIEAAYAMLIATMLPKGTDIAFIVEMIEDTVAQADEIDNNYLQFEGGLTPTSKVIYATYVVAEFINAAPMVTEEQVIKFTNYLLTRKHVQSVKDISLVLFALDKLGNNPFHVPVVVQLYGTPIVSDDKKMIKVRVTNVMDKAIGKMTVTAFSAEDADGLTVLSNKMFTAGPEDDFIIIESDIGRGMVAAHSYELNFMTSKPGAGLYTISISVKPQKEDKRLIGTSDGQVKVKVVTKVTIENVELSVVDKEQNIKAKTVTVQYPSAIGSVTEADHHQKVVMKFVLKSESTGDLFIPHQAFVRLTNQKTRQEIFFVAEPEPSKVFKFDLDVGATAKESFGSLSGKYKMDLIIGDAVIQNPFEWNVGVLSLTFAEEPTKPKKEKQTMYHSRPEIQHMFRVPEKRPPKAVSTAFTVLVFVPLVMMLLVWVKLGANMSNFPFSLGAIVFHLGLGAIFLLYYGFFISLNMFTTLKILAAIGTLTFLGGNSLLSNIAARRGKRLA